MFLDARQFDAHQGETHVDRFRLRWIDVQLRLSLEQQFFQAGMLLGGQPERAVEHVEAAGHRTGPAAGAAGREIGHQAFMLLLGERGREHLEEQRILGDGPGQHVPDANRVLVHPLAGFQNVRVPSSLEPQSAVPGEVGLDLRHDRLQVDPQHLLEPHPLRFRHRAGGLDTADPERHEPLHPFAGRNAIGRDESLPAPPPTQRMMLIHLVFVLCH